MCWVSGLNPTYEATGAVEVQTLPWIQTQTVAASQQVRVLRESQENIDLGEAEAIILRLIEQADFRVSNQQQPSWNLLESSGGSQPES